MGYLLKEALKTLCVVNQWSYAVFWKFGCQNPKLLIWEECYYELVSYVNLPKICGSMNSEPNACWASAEASASEILAPAGNKIRLLVNKMMMENHLNIVGEGLVGRAAFTGNHQWILSEKYTGEGHPPEVLKEVVQQISAGMQTVAVIPILPHGVVQLGSCLAIMENLAFVKDVKSLILQLGCCPGILLSDNYTTKEPAPKIGQPVYPGNSISMDTISSAPFVDSLNYLTNSDQTPSERVHDKLKSTGSTFDASNMARDLCKSHDEHCQAIIGSLTKLNIPSVGQVPNEVNNAEVIHSDADVWSNKASLYSPLSTFQQQSPVSSFAANSSMSLLEQRILSDAVFKHNNDNHLNVSDVYMTSPMRTNTCFISDSHESVVITPSVEVDGFFKDGNSHMKTVAGLDSLQDTNRSCNKNIASVPPVGNGIQHTSSSGAESSLSCMMDNLTANHLLSGHCNVDDTAVTSEMKEGIANELFHAISIPLPRNDEHLKFSEHAANFNHDDEKLRFVTQITSWDSPKLENSDVQHQSGDDLFDIFGIDFRNKMVNGSWNDFPHGGSHSNISNFNRNKLTSLTSQDAASDLYSVNLGNSESGIVSASGRDHLLDAVISTVHPSSNECLDDNISCISRVRSSSKQSLDDNISSKTTLTNMSSLSCPDTSGYPCGRAGVSRQVQGDGFGLPKSFLKAGLQGTCSLLSGSSKDNAGTYSQSSSTYGSQISSWVGQTHDIKQSSSVSTAYSKKPDVMSKTNRKRLKPGENPRPRPKDRQMIQDRVKELREIVPNSAKCSIDALLERTIKHMLFLQSVTKHADKLKQTGESKLFYKEGGLLKDSFEGGAMWAYEVGSQSMVCPIIVENLNQPRQMLVEMLCEERGLFLEIADIIRGLGLTILKGVMETHNDKIWASFAVEANRDVTRMEIFFSLVHLLDQTAKSGPSPTNGVGNDDMMVHQFHQATSISANSKPCGLQ